MDDGNGNSTNEGGSGGGDDVNLTPLSNLRVKSMADLAKLSDHLPVNWAELPKLPFFAPLIGFGDQWYRAAIALNVLETRWRGNRSLTPEEVQIVSTQTAKAVVTMSYEVPALLGTTWLYESRGRATFRFPFYQPGEAFNPNVFPTARYTLTTGVNARALWHLTRASLYASLSHVALRTLFMSYALSVKGVEFERDPRLADLRSSIRQTMTSRMSNRRLPVPAGPPLPVPESSSSSPEQEYPGSSEDGQADKQHQYQRSYRPLPPPPPPQPDAAGSDGFSDWDKVDSNVFDDASPVAPAEQRKGWQRQVTSTPGVSAWDRVRAQSASSDAHPAASHGWDSVRRGEHQPPPRPQPPTKDDYTFSDGTEEKSYARDQAQKDFDAMIERERRGDGDDQGRRR